MPNATQQILARATEDEVKVNCNEVLDSLQRELKNSDVDNKRYEYLCLLIVEDSELRQGVAAREIKCPDNIDIFFNALKASLDMHGSHRDLLNKTDANGVSLLMLAFIYGNKEIATFLIETGVVLEGACVQKSHSNLYHIYKDKKDTVDDRFILEGEDVRAIAIRMELQEIIEAPKSNDKHRPILNMYPRNKNSQPLPTNKSHTYDLKTYMFWGSIFLALILATSKATTEPPKLSLV